MEKVLAIVGPTAVGKTNLSIELAKKFNGEIISGDSMQVYKSLDIGTAKIKASEMQGIKHHLINIREIDQQYTVADFVNDARKIISELNQQGKLPIIVGGTGFYLQALLEGLSLGGTNSSPENEKMAFREQLSESTKLYGNQWLHDQLNLVDPKAAETIPLNNIRRMIRALEVYEFTGEKFSEQSNLPTFYNSFVIGLNTDRELLYQRINQRVDEMFQEGLIKEAETLFQQGGIELPAGKGIGYREFDSFFNGSSSIEVVTDEIKKDTRHYAKRQLTWFRNKTKPHWYDLVRKVNSIEEIEIDVKKWLDVAD